MSVYVDNGQYQFGLMKMSHMFADSLEELHAMAHKIGLKREWFQEGSTPHYDISQSKRAEAIKHGALEADRKKVVELIRYWRNKKESNMSKVKKLIDLCNEHGGSSGGMGHGSGNLGGKSGHPHVSTPGAVAIVGGGWEPYWNEHGACPPGWHREEDKCVKDKAED